MTIPVLINLQTLIDEQKCYETVRQIRWSEGVACSKCSSKSVVKRGFDETQLHRQRYQCQACRSRFDDLSDTIFAGHHQPGADMDSLSVLDGLKSFDAPNRG